MDPVSVISILSWALTNIPAAVALIQRHTADGSTPTPEQIAQMVGDAEKASETINAAWAAS